jgi:hypothetical protein
MSEKQNTTSPPCTLVNSKAQTSRTAASDKIQISRSFTAVWCKDGNNACPGHHLHFRGCAREVFKYMDMIRKKQNHGGFLFMRVSTIAANTKDFRNGDRFFSKIQVKRVLRIFQDLGIIGKYETRMIKGRAISGWQMSGHEWWAETNGGICDFKHWTDFEPKQRKCMGNRMDDTRNDTADDTPDDTDLGDNDTANDTSPSIVTVANNN